MSLLMYFIAPEGVAIYTDTLATTPDGVPRTFTTKCWPFPHLGMAMAVTGTAQVGYRWSATLNEVLLARDIDMLDVHTPDGLRRVVSDLSAEFGPLRGTSTVYHFGLSEARNRYVGYAYRSASNFDSEPLVERGFGVKPPPKDATCQPPQSLDEIITLAERIKAEQDAIDAGTRLHIGGDLTVVHMMNGVIGVSRPHRFADYEKHWDAMNQRLSGDGNGSPVIQTEAPDSAEECARTAVRASYRKRET